MILREKSVFPIVVFDKEDGWDSLRRMTKLSLSANGVDRLQSVLKGSCKSVVVEREYIDKDYRDTFSNFHSKRFNTPSSRCLRLHFFSVEVDESAIVSGEDALRKSYLGYSIVRPTRPNCIGRTLMTQHLRVEKEAHLSICRETVCLMGTILQIEGFPFISQDTDATVCAESALWMLFRYYSNRYNLYSEIRPFEITHLASRHALGNRIYPSGGLYSWQIAEAMRIQGFAPMVYSRKQFGKAFEHLLYTYIESGLPLLITVSGHVLAAFGHLSDYDSEDTVDAKDESRQMIYSSAFNRAFVVNDDNCYPYQMLRNSDRIAGESKFTWENILEFIVPLPEKVFLPAEQVQTAMEQVLDNPRLGPISQVLPNGCQQVRRLFLTTARSFKASLRERGMGHPVVEGVYRQLPMPHFIWVCEISLQNSISYPLFSSNLHSLN